MKHTTITITITAVVLSGALSVLAFSQTPSQPTSQELQTQSRQSMANAQLMAQIAQLQSQLASEMDTVTAKDKTISDLQVKLRNETMAHNPPTHVSPQPTFPHSTPVSPQHPPFYTPAPIK